jgi:IS5 family transposase
VQILYTIRSERLLMEQLAYNLLFRWFVGLGMDEPVWDASTFSKNRDRLLAGEVAQAFFRAVLELAREHQLLSDEHFTVDGTLLEAWAGHKSFKRKDAAPSDPPADAGNADVDFRGEPRSNATHESTTDPDARLFKKAKGHAAQLGYLGHVLMENRHGLVVDTRVTQATGTAEREAAAAMLHGRRGTVGGDKAYDTRDFVKAARAAGVTPHVAQNQTNRRSAIDGRTTRHRGYVISQLLRKRIEEIFGWGKRIGLLDQLRHRGLERVDWVFTFTAAAYNLVRMRNLIAATG